MGDRRLPVSDGRGTACKLISLEVRAVWVCLGNVVSGVTWDVLNPSKGDLLIFCTVTPVPSHQDWVLTLLGDLALIWLLLDKVAIGSPLVRALMHPPALQHGKPC